MRLLNTITLKLESFFGRELPIYAILSHTWGDEEVTLQDMVNPVEAESKPGYAKLRGCCKKAAEDGYAYVWIDACCIDKTSSAELSEAINSMYIWYKNSDVCYVHLSDVETPFEVYIRSGHTIYALPKAFKHSRWFTRGWTLQELIAPRTVEFYTATWEEIGTKQSLGDEIALITGIESRVLQGSDLAAHHVAEKMSWAASRITTRVEDMSYCLLGIFNIHMPLLYGEGKRAFIRLQKEILRTTDDYTILARGFHSCLSDTPSIIQPSSVPSKFPLATDIIEFSASGHSDEQRYSNLVKDRFTSAAIQNNPEGAMGGSAQPPLLLTAKGLYITLPMQKISSLLSAAYLHCRLRVSNEIVCLVLTELSPGRYQKNDTAYRPYRFMPVSALSSFRVTSIYIQQEYISVPGITHQLGTNISPRKLIVEVEPTDFRSNFKLFTNHSCLVVAPDWPFKAIYSVTRFNLPEILCEIGDHDNFIVKLGNKLGWTADGNYWCHCFMKPEEQTEQAWGSHLGDGIPESNSQRWNYFPAFVPENPTDRLRETLRTSIGTVSVSIREYPPVPDRNLEGRVVAKIRIEKL